MTKRRLTIHSILLLCAALAVTGCDARRAELIDGQMILDEADAPEVIGVNATMEQNAIAAAEVGDYNRAMQIYEQLIDRDKKNKRYLLAYAESSRKAGNKDAALAAYEALLILSPSNIDAKEGKALALLDKGEFQDAGDLFSEVLKTDRRRWRTLNGLAILFVIQDMHDEAMAYFTEALVQSPNNASVLNNVGLTLAISDKQDDAVAALQKASELVPSTDKHLRRKIEMNLAMVYGAMGDLDNAKAVASKHLHGPALNNNMGFYAHLAKDDALAKSYLNMALTRNPRYYERAWSNLNRIEGQENAADAKGTYGGKRVKVQ